MNRGPWTTSPIVVINDREWVAHFAASWEDVLPLPQTLAAMTTVSIVDETMREPQDNGDERAEDLPLAAEPESFGTWLRRQREVREIDLREIADSSKVSMSYLRAFEEDRFDVLPAPLFAKGFLRQYARYVGLDPEEVVNFYLAARQPESEEPSLQPHTEPEPPTHNYLFFALAITAALVLVVWLLSVFGDRAPGAPVSTSSPGAGPGSPQRGANATESPQDNATSSGIGTNETTSRTGADETSPQRGANEMRSPTVAGGPMTTAAGSGTVPPERSVPEPSSQQAEEPDLPLRVTLDFLSDCWVEASVDGAEKLSELKVQGESLLLGAEELVEFKVGDVGAVQVEVNGIPFEIEGRRGTSVRNVRIDLETAAMVAGGGPRSTALPGDAPEGRKRKPNTLGADR